MLDKETTLLDIKTKFISHWYKNFTNIKNLKKNEKDIITKISRCAILSNNVSDKEQIIHIRFNMSSFNYTLITEYLNIIFNDIPLKGIENIYNIDDFQERRYTFNKETGEVNIEKEYVVYTNGINFEKMLFMKGIDFARTKCNDIYTTYKLYGIEAVRQILIHELTTAFESYSINQNHLSLLVDQMCHNGEIISIDRHGLSKIDIDPITRASFEKTMEHFVNAALFNEKDNVKLVSSRIAMGRVINGGTGAFDILLDTKKIENSEYNENDSLGRITYVPLEEEPLLSDIITNSGNHNFFLPN
jgi:DNA-directed RNA polymerase beta' subunit